MLKNTNNFRSYSNFKQIIINKLYIIIIIIALNNNNMDITSRERAIEIVYQRYVLKLITEAYADSERLSSN